MMSSSGESSPESSDDFADADSEEHSFENPNYRKLYAALSITSMMGNNDHNQQMADNKQSLEDPSKVITDHDLPIGWERHEDENGPYFWHIPSGTIQRDPPIDAKTLDSKRNSIIFFDNLDAIFVPNQAVEGGDDSHAEDESALTILVHSLGWMEVEESQLTSANSSKLIQKCIIELSTRGDNNAVRCWGRQTQELVLKVENNYLKLYEMASNAILMCQPIQAIRVWGVNDNNDFAFVARDLDQSSDSTAETPLLASPGLKCHVFHCEDEDNSAQRIATYLRDEMIKLKSMSDGSLSPSLPASHNRRPKHLFIYDNSPTQPSSIATPTAIEFPTPIEEPRKSITAKFLGRTKVTKPMGIEVLNKAIETILYEESDEQNRENDSQTTRYNMDVLVHISPSTITIESKETSECLAECRVRYLSFLGIGSHNVRICGFIMQIDEKEFEALCFECEPSSGALCKTIEAACKLRYQKCLDAHRQRLAADNASSKQQNSSGIKSTIINVFSKLSNNIRKN